MESNLVYHASGATVRIILLEMLCGCKHCEGRKYYCITSINNGAMSRNVRSELTIEEMLEVVENPFGHTLESHGT